MKKIKSVLAGILCLTLFAQTAVYLKAENSSTYTVEPHEVNIAYESDRQMLAEMKFVCENDYYSFYYNSDTLAIALLNKSDDKVYLSNPYNASSDPFYSGEIKSQIDSQIVLEYLNRDENQKKTLFSSTDCVEFGQYNVTETQDGLDIEMTIGELTKTALIPSVMSEESFFKFTAQMPSRAAGRMEIFYERISADEITDEKEKKSLLSKYPALKDGAIYVCGELSEKEKQDVAEYLNEVGYSENDYKADTALGGAEVEVDATPSFKMTLSYILSKDGLTASIDSNSITYDNDAFALLNIRVLEFFGADVSKENGNGYLFIPDGSGSIIEMDDTVSNRRQTISGSVYGGDLTKQETEDESGEQFYLPVFGIVCNDGGALMAHITAGDEVSTITAALGEPSSCYYRTYNTFSYLAYDYLRIDTKVSSHNSALLAYRVNKTPYKGTFAICFTPLSGDDANYSGMAKLYRKRLIEAGLNYQAENTKAETELNLIGSALYSDTFLGFSVKKTAVFTDFENAEKIINWFSEQSVDNMHVIYSGWQDKGLNAPIAGKQKISGKLGGKSGFKKLLETGIEIIPSVDPVFSSYQYAFDGFSQNSDTARRIDNEYAGIKFNNLSTERNNLRYLLSPIKYERVWSKLSKSLKTQNIKSAMLENAGIYLASDAKNDSNASRYDTKKLVSELLSGFSCEKLWFNGANAYVLPFASGVTEVSLSDSDFKGETHSVPFYQIATDGLIVKSSKSLNLSEDWERELLACVESRTSPSYSLAYENVALLKETDFTKYYSVDYMILRERIAEEAARYNSELIATENAQIINHIILSADVTLTEYDNGCIVLVNKTSTDYNWQNVTVGAMDYEVIAKEEHSDEA